MTPTKYQKYVFGLKSGHLKIGANGAGAYAIPRSVSYCGAGTIKSRPQCAREYRHVLDNRAQTYFILPLQTLSNI